MKKYRWVFTVIVAVILAAVLCFTVENYITVKKKYTTSLESFKKSAPNNSALVEVIDHGDANILVYKNSKNKYSYAVVSKTLDGWTSIKYNDCIKTRKKIYKNKFGVRDYIEVTKIGDKYLVIICCKVFESFRFHSAAISDSINSDFNGFSAFEEGRENGIVIFSVLLDSIPEDYYILYGDYKIFVKA